MAGTGRIVVIGHSDDDRQCGRGAGFSFLAAAGD